MSPVIHRWCEALAFAAFSAASLATSVLVLITAIELLARLA